MNEYNNTGNWIIKHKKWESWPRSNRCPNCGSDEIEYNTMIILTSHPPQAQLRCKSCGHYFSSGHQEDLIDRDVLDKAWEHTQSILGIPRVGDWPPAPTLYDPLDIQQQLNYGWICPKCGRCLAPHVNSCPHCSEPTTINITY